MMKVEWADRKQLSQIYAQGLEYTLVEHVGDGQFKGMHPPVRCKDYYQDIFWSQRSRKPFHIYCFDWTPNTVLDKQIADGTLLMALRYEDGTGMKELKQFKDGLQNFLNAWEAVLGYKASTVEVSDDGLSLLIAFGPQWIEKPVSVSLFTLLLRVGIGYGGQPIMEFMSHVAKNGNVWGKNDGSYIQGSLPKLESILAEKSISWPQQFEDYAACTTSLHSCSGILSYTPPEKETRTVNQP